MEGLELPRASTAHHITPHGIAWHRTTSHGVHLAPESSHTKALPEPSYLVVCPSFALQVCCPVWAGCNIQPRSLSLFNLDDSSHSFPPWVPGRTQSSTTKLPLLPTQKQYGTPRRRPAFPTFIYSRRLTDRESETLDQSVERGEHSATRRLDSTRKLLDVARHNDIIQQNITTRHDTTRHTYNYILI